jgi:thioredoxin-related protein
MRPIVNGLEKEYAGRVRFDAHEWRNSRSRALVEKYGVTETPTFVILDSAGAVRMIISGELTRDELRAHIERALNS